MQLQKIYTEDTTSRILVPVLL